MEIWKPIIGHEDSHEVSNMGRIRSIRRRINSGYGSYIKRSNILNFANGRSPYCKVRHVMLSAKKVSTLLSVSDIVANVFIDNPDNKIYTRHINGDLSDNTVDNIEWSDEIERPL